MAKTINASDVSTIVPLKEFAKQLPGEVSYYAVRLWHKVGRKSDLGKTVKLRTVRMPWGRGTSMKHYLDFIRELNDDR